MNKEDILVWLTQLGNDWVDWVDVQNKFNFEKVGDIRVWHDGAYVTKRYKLVKYTSHEPYIDGKPCVFDIPWDQYRLTKKAIRSLEE
jgi:hypothetical protein